MRAVISEVDFRVLVRSFDDVRSGAIEQWKLEQFEEFTAAYKRVVPHLFPDAPTLSIAEILARKALLALVSRINSFGRAYIAIGRVGLVE